jgi:hypothetical protein
LRKERYARVDSRFVLLALAMIRPYGTAKVNRTGP